MSRIVNPEECSPLEFHNQVLDCCNHNRRVYLLVYCKDYISEIANQKAEKVLVEVTQKAKQAEVIKDQVKKNKDRAEVIVQDNSLGGKTDRLVRHSWCDVSDALVESSSLEVV